MAALRNVGDPGCISLYPRPSVYSGHGLYVTHLSNYFHFQLKTEMHMTEKYRSFAQDITQTSNYFN